MFQVKFLRNLLSPCRKKNAYALRWSSNAPSHIIIPNQGVNISLSDGKQIKLSTGKYARFANGTGVCQMGGTSMMATAVTKISNSSNVQNFMPLTVDFRQKYAAAGRIPTNFFRRELGASEKEILTSRLIDRSLRPLFPTEFTSETQIACNMLALDSVHAPDVASINAASFALAVSDIPWNGPVGAVRLGLTKDGMVMINPSRLELQSSTLDLILTGTKNKLIVMMEGRADSVSWQNVTKAINVGTKATRAIAAAIEEYQIKYGKQKQVVSAPTPVDSEIVGAIRSLSEMRLNEAFQNYSYDKIERDQAVKLIRDDVVNRTWSNFPQAEPSVITNEFNKIVKETFRELLFSDKRCDGRKLDELRKISCEVDLHEPLHGSALFQRGQTQVMATVALDSIDSALKLDSMTALNTGVRSKNFFLHYEFPPYATGEIGKIGGVGRREIGHGALAEKGLLSVIPEKHPFTIRLTAEVLESNGSSSMATVCAGSLALMDAGVEIQSPAAGVAMGLVTKYNKDNPYELEDYRILTDILGIEDYLGDMDMKIASTKEGITAIQADIKTHGIPMKVIQQAVEQSIKPTKEILNLMENCISKYRQTRKECWPVTKTITLEPSLRSALIGPGGMNLKKILVETGAHITEIEPGTFTVFAPSQMAMDETDEIINEMVKLKSIPELEFGAIYTAKIVEMKDNGVLVKIYDAMKPTLIHVAQLDNRRVAHPSALGFEVGHEIKVKYFGKDPVSGFMRLSRKMITSTASDMVVDLKK